MLLATKPKHHPVAGATRGKRNGNAFIVPNVPIMRNTPAKSTSDAFPEAVDMDNNKKRKVVRSVGRPRDISKAGEERTQGKITLEVQRGRSTSVSPASSQETLIEIADQPGNVERDEDEMSTC